MKFKHLDETGFTYFEHFKISSRWSIRMLKLSCCAFAHSFWPDVHTTTVSDSIKKYAKEIELDSKKYEDTTKIS